MQTALNLNEQMDNDKSIIALITFPMNMSVYRKESQELVRIPNTWILRDTTHPIVSIEDGVAELSDGRYVKNIFHNKPKIYYGEIHVIDMNVPVFKRNGTFSRYLSKGQVLKVVSNLNVNGTHYLGINECEVVSSIAKGLNYTPVNKTEKEELYYLCQKEREAKR